MVEAAPARSPRVRAATVGMVLAAAAGIGLFAWFRIWQARVGGPLVWQDSLQYRALGNQPLLSHRIWAGERPPVIPLLWKLAGSDTTFVLLQTLASVAAWSTLAVVAARRVRPWWGRLVAGAAVLGFATTRPVTQWDRSVLSESLSLTLLALLFAVAILWERAPTLPRSLGVIAVGLLFAATRDTQIWVIALVAVAFGAYAAWRGLRVDATSARPALVVAAGLVAVVVLTGASSMASHRDVQNVQNALAVRVFPYPSRIALVRRPRHAAGGAAHEAGEGERRRARARPGRDRRPGGSRVPAPGAVDALGRRSARTCSGCCSTRTRC